MEHTEKRSTTMSLKETPYYFSHYANMGRHNAYNIICYVSEKLLLTKKVNEEQLYQCELLSNKTYKNKPDKRAVACKLLCQHFPFLSHFSEKEINGSNKDSEVMAALKSYLTDLNNFRNEYSHFGHEHIHLNLQEVQEVFEHAVGHAQVRMQQTLTEADFGSLHSAKYLNPLWGDAANENNNGIFFFLCLFLDKKYAFQFLGKLSEFKNTFRARLEAFTQLCCRLPYPKLESADITLDMLNELARCPKELYNVLSADDQKKFLAKEEAEEGEETDDNEPIMKRHGSRFPYFTLRHFEKTETGETETMLKGIQFQLNLGRVHKEAAHKKVINGETRQHPILKEVHLFGRLADYQADAVQKKLNPIEQKKLNPTDNPHFELYSPKYNITGNRIALSLTPYDSQHLKTAVQKLIQGKDVKRFNHPQAILSIHELPALFFYNHLHRQGKIEHSPQELIKDYIENFKKFIDDMQNGKIKPVEVKERFRKKRHHTEEEKLSMAKATAALQLRLNKYNLKVKDLPDACREYLLSYEERSTKKAVAYKLVQMQKETERRLRLLKDIQTNGFRNRAGTRNGDLAQEIADDIVFLTKPQHQTDRSKPPKKINGMEYNILQKALAYFPIYKEDLEGYLSMLKEAGSGRWTHPFLYRVISVHLQRCKTLLDFSVDYYTEKEKWLKRLLFTDKSGKVDLNRNVQPDELAYFMKFIDKTKEAVKKKWNTECIYLPVGLFEEGIRKAMGLKETDSVGYALKCYFDGKTQPFYQLPRYYHKTLGERDTAVPRDELRAEIESGYKTADEENQTEWKKVTKRIRTNETEILRRQAEDRVLFLMAEFEGERLPTADIERIGFNVEERNLLDNDRPFAISLYGKQITATLPIKRYGEFRRFMKDRRLKGLLSYYDADTVPLGVLASSATAQKGQKGIESNLVEEMECYDKQREELIKTILRFEELVSRHYQGEKIIKDGEVINHWAYIEAAKRAFPVIDSPTEQLNELRNKLLHNEIPYEDWIKEEIAKNKSSVMITERIIALARNYYDKIIQTIEETHT
jgi:hypothetical protein